MIGHETITDYCYPVSNTRSAQGAQVDPPFTVVEKNRLSVISTLPDVVYAARNDNSRSAWHRKSSFVLR
jgi:hypothetical protein